MTEGVRRRTFLLSGLAGGIAAAGLLPSQGMAQPSPEAVFDDPAGPVLGNPEGDVTIVEYFDYQCPYCKTNHPVLKELVRRDGRIRLLPKDWPIFGAASLRASQMALGAHRDGRYAQAHDALMTAQGPLDATRIDRILDRAGLSPQTVEASYNRNRGDLDAYLGRNAAQAAGFGFPGTPAFIVGFTLYPGALDRRALQEAVARARR